MYGSLIACKLFCPNIVFIYAHLAECSTRRRSHRWRSSYVINGTSQDADVREKHLQSDMPSLPLPTVVVGRAREGRNKTEPWICSLQLSERINECRIVQVAVRVEQNNTMAKLLLGGVSEDADEWRDPDSAGDEDSRPGCVFVEAKRAHGTFNPGHATDRQDGYSLLESCASQARRD